MPLLALLYLLPFPYFPALHSPNEGSRLYQVRAIVDDGTFAVNGPLRRYGPIGDLAVDGGRYYPNKAPGISILGAAVYAAAKALVGWDAGKVSNAALLYLLRACCCALPTLLFLAALRRRLWAWTGAGVAADAAVAAYGLGSLAYTYGLLFFSHQLCAVLLGGSFLLLETAREEDRLAPAAWAGLCAGGAVLVEYTAALAALPLGLYALLALKRRFRGTLAFGLASLPPQLALLAYHRAAYGSPFETGYRHNVSQQFQAWHSHGFMGVGLPTWNALGGSFFDPSRGLLIFSPFLALAPLGIWLLWKDARRRPAALLLAALTALYTLFTASFVFDAWGWTVGPRHLAPLAAFLVLPAGVAIASLRRRSPAWGGFAAGLCALSVLITGLATVTYPHIPDGVFGNAFFEVTLPLLVSGDLPRTVLSFFGAGPWVWGLYFAAFAAVVGWLFLAVPGRGPGRPTALVTAALALAILSVSGKELNPAAKRAQLDFIERTYRSP
ncbi:MAG: hypothetical protein ACYDCL_20290 [Myxococcales bacterium]